MGKLAQQLGGQSQVKVTDKKPAGKKVVNMKSGGGVFGGKESKAEEARERKSAPSKAAYKKAEAKYEGEGMKRGGCVKKMKSGGSCGSKAKKGY